MFQNSRRSEMFPEWGEQGENINDQFDTIIENANLYLVLHKMTEVTINRVFDGYQKMVKQLKIDGMGGDYLKIYPIVLTTNEDFANKYTLLISIEANEGAQGFIPDLDGLVPITDDDDEDEDEENDRGF